MCCQIPQKRGDPSFVIKVETCRGFVSHDQRHGYGRRHSDQNTLSLSPGKLMRKAAHDAFGVSDPRQPQPFDRCEFPAHFRHLRSNAHCRVQRVEGVLGDDPHQALPGSSKVGLARTDQFLTDDTDRALIRGWLSRGKRPWMT